MQRRKRSTITVTVTVTLPDDDACLELFEAVATAALQHAPARCEYELESFPAEDGVTRPIIVVG